MERLSHHADRDQARLTTLPIRLLQTFAPERNHPRTTVLSISARSGAEMPASQRSGHPILKLQRTIGNQATQRILLRERVRRHYDHHSIIQRQPPPSTKLLTPAAAGAAVADVTKRYDEDSIRTLELLAGQPRDGVFNAADAEAFAAAQTALRLTPNGKADEPFLDAVLKSAAGPGAAARSTLIHLVIDYADLNVSGVLNVVFDDGLAKASDVTPSPGGVNTIKIGKTGFASYKVMLAAIKKQLAARRAASPTTTVPAAVLANPAKQQSAITANKAKVRDPLSIRLLQGAVESKPTGIWDVQLVRHIAARQSSLGLPAEGILDDTTFAAVAGGMAVKGWQDAVLRLITDYYALDRSHAFDIVFVPNPHPTRPSAEAETTRVANPVGTPGVVRVFPLAFTQSFAGLVHTVAHELGHIQQVIAGIDSENVREFLSEGIEIESAGLPKEPIEAVSDLALMNQSKNPVNTGFIHDVHAMLIRWGRMTLAEKRTHLQRFRNLRAIVHNRIAAEATSAQKQELLTFQNRLNAADAGLP